MAYKIIIGPKAIEDIQQAIDYYDEKQIGLGQKFERNLNQHIKTISKNPIL